MPWGAVRPTASPGTLTGTFGMDGVLTGEVELDVTIAATLEAGDDGTTVQRVTGSTTVTGTATSDYGSDTIDVTR